MHPPDFREISRRYGINDYWMLKYYFYNFWSLEGESEGYTVKTKDDDFTISDYPLLQTEFMYESKTGKADISRHLDSK